MHKSTNNTGRCCLSCGFLRLVCIRDRTTCEVGTSDTSTMTGQITWTASPFFDMIAVLSAACDEVRVYHNAVEALIWLVSLHYSVWLERCSMIYLMTVVSRLRLHELLNAMRPL